MGTGQAVMLIEQVRAISGAFFMGPFNKLTVDLNH
jgi:hypothetical protein